MPKRNPGLFDLLVTAPWPFGIAAGLIGYVIVRYGVVALLASSDNRYASGVATSLQSGALTPLAWAVLGIGVLASLVSFVNAGRRRRLLESRAELDSLRDISWREFERLTGEMFRRRGYAVQETGGNGADGGVDLLLRKDGALEIVQCKQWKQRHVSVSVAREVYGLLQHHGARKAWIVCCGDFSPDAARFVEGKSIELLTGQQLLDAIRAVQTPRSDLRTVTLLPETAPACPVCSAAMLRRTNRRSGEAFWGCSEFPKCRGTVTIRTGR